MKVKAETSLKRTEHLFMSRFAVLESKSKESRGNKASTEHTQETPVFVCLTQQKKKGARTQTETAEAGDYVRHCTHLFVFHVWVNVFWRNGLLHTSKTAHSLCFWSNFTVSRNAVTAVYSARYMTVHCSASGCFSSGFFLPVSLGFCWFLPQ